MLSLNSRGTWEGSLRGQTGSAWEEGASARRYILWLFSFARAVLFCCSFQDGRYLGPGVELGNVRFATDPLTVYRYVQGLLGAFLDLSGNIWYLRFVLSGTGRRWVPLMTAGPPGCSRNRRPFSSVFNTFLPFSFKTKTVKNSLFGYLTHSIASLSPGLRYRIQIWGHWHHYNGLAISKEKHTFFCPIHVFSPIFFSTGE